MADQFQQNIDLRIEIKQFLQSKKNSLPSALGTSITLSKTITKFYNSLEDPSSEGFIKLLRSV